MEAWSSLNAESRLYKGNGESGTDIVPTVEQNGIDAFTNRLKSVFDQGLAAFLREKKCVRPLPVLTGDGQPLDLFTLYWIVRKIGGYDLVSSKNLWGFVSEHCKLEVTAVSFVKLAYIKYLTEFDHWLRQLHKENGNSENGEGEVIRQLDLLSNELLKKKDVTLLLPKNDCKQKDICKVNCQVDFEMFTAESVISSEGVAEKILYGAPNKSNRQIDDDDNNKSTVKLKEKKGKGESSCFSGMLNWITDAAKNSNDPKIGVVPDSSKWKSQTSEEFWFQALSVKEALLKKRHIDANQEESPAQKKQRMHPSMYEEDQLQNQPVEKQRCSKRIPTSLKHNLCPCCSNSCLTSQNKVQTHHKEREEGEEDTQPDLTSIVATVARPDLTSVVATVSRPDLTRVVATVSRPDLTSVVATAPVSLTEETDDPTDQKPHVEVFVGPLYQAEVPEWTGVISDSDSKWLGTRMWPPEVEKTKPCVELTPIGRGRKSSCDCPFPQSVECIRFHIAEKRFRLNLELGPLFNRWRFHRMGEEVSLSWTAEEEERFKAMVRSSSVASHLRNKWNRNFKKMFPSKTREMLVSYYFNVYLIKRRIYQNRVTPKDLDSDDDEVEFGSVGDSFGHIKVPVPGARSLMCIQNTECHDLLE